MNIAEIDILQLLPQRPPMVMVDSLVSFTPERTVTTTLVRAGNIFVDDGSLSAPGLIENIAQTCAARIGYVNKFIYRQQIRIGFIGAIRNLRLLRLPRVGERLTTTIDTVEEVFGMTLVNATVICGEEIIAEGSMKIALSNAPNHSPA
ncbi:MAG: pseudouridylate synthase [Candidatus Amulumruptor caecigallinarius]|nr:pseudouridylate synthase [Candidatus Amulumruptor caecigallinarius]MCM1396346.1 pseudouridylate synthase [Candidatus Amulumruptor caecigallinarius]MCM1453712.1 pseudouridylate synthase [bacterium]